MLRVLVVESGAPAARSLVLSLARHGYQAASVDTGSEALQKYREADVLLIDLDLPDLDGIEICRFVRAASGSESSLSRPATRNSTACSASRRARTTMW